MQWSALGLVGLAATLSLAPSCANPTAVRLEVFSEVDCAMNAPAVLVTAASLAELGASAPSASSTKCEAGNLGSVVVTPGGARDATLSFAMMTRPDGQSADGCLDAKTANGCIVAKRRLRFEPKTEIAMRVDLRLSCLNVTCPDDQTCVRGACTSADIVCGDACDESVLLPADADGGVRVDGSVVAPDGASDGSIGDAGFVDGGPPAPPLVPLGGPYATTTAALAVGEDHACVLSSSGQVGCFGANNRGQLGDGTFTPRTAPGVVGGIPPASSIAAGDGFTCATLANNGVVCWGANDRGQLGDGSNDPFATSPRQVVSLPSATSLSLGAAHACAATSIANAVSPVCWGANDFGQLGSVGTAPESRTPILVPGIQTTVLRVAAGRGHSCAGGTTVAGSETIWCWGDNTSGQLGDGTTTSRAAAAPIANPSDAGVQSVAAGSTHSCSVSGNRISCWGSNAQRQIASGTLPQHLTPLGAGVLTRGVTDANGMLVFTTYAPALVTVGEAHGCQLSLPSEILCWGRNDLGQLGPGVTGDKQTQTFVPALDNVTAVSAHGSSTCALGPFGIRCFGKVTADFPLSP